MVDYLEHYDSERLRLIVLPAGVKYTNGKWRTGTVAELAALLTEPSNIGMVYQNGLTGLDADTPATWQAVSARLESLGVHTWHVRRPENGSPHDGGGLAVVRVDAPAAGRPVDGLDVKRSGYSLIPNSTHPAGGAYYFEDGHAPPDVPIVTVEPRDLAPWLEAPAPSPAASRLELESTIAEAGIKGRRVPPLARAILAGELAVTARYVSRSEAEQAAVASLVNAGWTFSEIAEVFIGSRAGRFREEWQRRPGGAVAWLERSYAKALTFVIANVHPVRARALELRSLAERAPWPGRTGGTDRAVMLACCTIAARSCRSEWHASEREIAELAGIHRRTAARSLARLAAKGIIKRIAPAEATEPTRWSLTDEASCNVMCPYSHRVDTTTSTTEYGHITLQPSTPAGHDVWRRNGLGKSAHGIMVAMADGGRHTAKELAQLTGRHRQTIWKNLKHLVAVGLVEPCDWSAGKVVAWQAVATAPDLDAIAEELGTAGSGKRQREAHERQRLAHRATLDKWRAENGQS